MSPAGPAVAVPEAHQFDHAALGAFLHDRLAGFDGPFDVVKFSGGQSNPTYRLDTAAGSYVLRKKPPGQLLPSAHAIEREFTAMRALAAHLPLPRMHLLCEDQQVIGQAFYVMEFVDGRLIADGRMIEAERDERAALHLSMVETLASLHRLDYRAVGLDGFGQPDRYIARQLFRWARQYASSRIEDNADMDQVIAWLEANVPEKDETGIVHGDFRNHNLIYRKDSQKVAAVLDWELATIGHPLADLAYLCLPYHLPPEDVRGFRGEDRAELGLPSEDEVLAAYCRETGRSGVPHLHYFLVFSLFRSAAIRAGVLRRAMDGNASDARAMETGSAYRGTAAFAWRLAQSRRPD